MNSLPSSVAGAEPFMKNPDPILVLAPMRGITTTHYRQTFVKHFAGLNQEMAPFISTVNAEKINPKLLKDILPENSSGLPLIPQLIGNNADDFVQMATAIQDLGYNEVNLNMGCPHKPIRKKKRGSGLLAHPDRVDMLLDQICDRSPIEISVKVRLGVSNKSELLKLIPILNQFPLTEVIIHPRTAEQMYEGSVDLDAFAEAFERFTLPICYNGDISALSFYQQVKNRFSKINHFMIGRGLLANPFLCEEIKCTIGNKHKDTTVSRLGVLCDLSVAGGKNNHIERIAAFHDELLGRYEAILHGDYPVLGRMKEFWTYQSRTLSNGLQLFKKLKKTTTLYSYRAIVNEFLSKAEWSPQS